MPELVLIALALVVGWLVVLTVLGLLGWFIYRRETRHGR